MSEMVERVAEAMWWQLAQKVPGLDRSSWAIAAVHPSDEPQEHWRTLARAAIEAMREPTDAIMLAAFEPDGEVEFARAVWKTMIDEALK